MENWNLWLWENDDYLHTITNSIINFSTKIQMKIFHFKLLASGCFQVIFFLQI
jgi:hypothetical protein